MLATVLMVHVACNGFGFLADAVMDCVRETSLTYANARECNGAIRDRTIPYTGVTYQDLFCELRWVAK